MCARMACDLAAVEFQQSGGKGANRWVKKAGFVPLCPAFVFGQPLTKSDISDGLWTLTPHAAGIRSDTSIAPVTPELAHPSPDGRGRPNSNSAPDTFHLDAGAKQ